MNSLAAARSTKQEEKQLCPPGARRASPGSWEELGSLPRTSQLARIKHSGDNFPGVQPPTPSMRADTTFSPTAASQESTNLKEVLGQQSWLQIPQQRKKHRARHHLVLAPNTPAQE